MPPLSLHVHSLGYIALPRAAAPNAAGTRFVLVAGGVGHGLPPGATGAGVLTEASNIVYQLFVTGARIFASACCSLSDTECMKSAQRAT